MSGNRFPLAMRTGPVSQSKKVGPPRCRAVVPRILEATYKPFALMVLFAAASCATSGSAKNAKGSKQQRAKDAIITAKVGEEAPNFKLKTRDGKKEVELATFRGEKPVVLVFGSYT